MRYLFLIICLFLSTNLEAQTNYFSGKIMYKYKFYDANSGNDITEKMTSIHGKEQHYFIHSDSYKSFDDKGNFGQLYIGQNNKYYYRSPDSDEIMMMDASVNFSKIVSISHTDMKEEILGKICKQLIIKTDSDKTVYFYSDEITVDPLKFTGHKLGDWSEFLKASNGALPLKYIVENKDYTWVSTAIEISRMNLTANDFDPEIIFK